VPGGAFAWRIIVYYFKERSARIEKVNHSTDANRPARPTGAGWPTPPERSTEFGGFAWHAAGRVRMREGKPVPLTPARVRCPFCNRLSLSRNGTRGREERKKNELIWGRGRFCGGYRLSKRANLDVIRSRCLRKAIGGGATFRGRFPKQGDYPLRRRLPHRMPMAPGGRTRFVAAVRAR